MEHLDLNKPSDYKEFMRLWRNATQTNNLTELLILREKIHSVVPEFSLQGWEIDEVFVPKDATSMDSLEEFREECVRITNQMKQQ